ncbi:MAG: aldo/keto reductase [Lachnospiraceae bacterium]|nr:aldo/keto reductase [Lachnospiraceae bacterium]MCR4938284.1 aldo/keto reductase [Lachnospiraceae bacterium]
MEKRRFEKLGIDVSLLGFGCMRFPVGEDGKINRPLAEKMLDKAIASGVNYIDTAYPYHDGESELFVGEALKKYPRDSFYLATKLPVWFVNTVEDVDKYFNEQLEKLQTDHFDFYLMHALNKDSWAKQEKIGTVKRLEELKAEGKIRFLGFSFHDDYDTFEKIINYRDWDFCQIQLNYMDINDQAGMKGYKLAEEKGIPLTIMEPVKGGSLASFSDDIMDVFASVRPGKSAASFALRYVATLPNILTVLSGMSSMEQVEDNLSTFIDFVPMEEKEYQAIDKIKEIMNSRIQNGCTGCRYCMPCPFGVDIPGNFSVWNRYHMYQRYNVVSWQWDGMKKDNKTAAECKQCGKCEQACPQHLSIREDLKKVLADLNAAAGA